MDLEAVWGYREETIYPALFGAAMRGIFPLGPESFSPFPNAAIDPRWLHHGIFEFAPHADRQSWLYITSGYSNPWQTAPKDYNPDGPSGSGVEFAMETETQGNWAIRFLQKMLAYDMMLSSGQLGDKPPLKLEDRIPLGGPIDGRHDTPVTSVVLVAPENFPLRFELPSGWVEILQFTGITDSERDLAREKGIAALRAKMRAENGFPVTQLLRS